MNNVTINGYIYKNGSYTFNEEKGKFEYNFYLKVHNPILNEAQGIKCKAVGWLADECTSNMCENCYVEVIGSLANSKTGKTYVLVNSITYKKPKSKRQFYIKTTEFLEYFKPTSILERLKVNEQNKKK